MLLIDIYNELDIKNKRRYEPLVIFFKEWTTDDIEKLDDDEASYLVIYSEELSDRNLNMLGSLFKLFIREFGRSHFLSSKTVDNSIIHSDNLKEHESLDYSGRVVPELLKGFAGPNRVPLSSIYSEMSTILLQDKKYYDNVTYVDFSLNSLIDPDAVMLVSIIQKMRSPSVYNEYILEKKKEDLILDISFNRFHGYEERYQNMLDTCLIEILELPFVSLLICFGNPLASVDRVDFFISMFHQRLLRKLIFINNTVEQCTCDSTFLKFANQNNVLQLNEIDNFVAEAKETHLNFYNKIISK